MNKGVIIFLLVVGVVCMFFQHQITGEYALYIKTLGILLTMFSVYKLSSKVTSKKEDKDSGNFKF